MHDVIDQHFSPDALRAPWLLSAILAGLMFVQALTGLVFQNAYRDVEWVRATWYGNDWITLVLAVPLLVVALWLVRRDGVHARLVWPGMLGYCIYNYAFYALGAELNMFFPLYLVLLVLSLSTLVLLLVRTDVERVAAAFRRSTPVRSVGGYFVFVSCTLAVIWMVIWGMHVFAGRPTPVEPDAFRLVAVLDCTLMVPALAAGGAMLWHRMPWGFMLASIAGIQATLYLTVLATNSVVAINRNLAEWPGELPLWGGLAIATALATGMLLSGVPRR